MTNTRRLYCRCGFLLFCVVPTALVLTWVLFPASTSHWEDNLSRILGLNVSIQQASQPRPNTTLLRGIELADSELGTLATIRVAEAVETNHKQMIFISQPEIRCDQLHRIFELLEDQLLRQRNADIPAVRLIAGELTMRSSQSQGQLPQRAETLADVTCEVEQGNTPRVTLTFRRFGQATPEPVTLKLDRHAGKTNPPSTNWSLDTGGAFLPIWLLAGWWPGLNRLGDDCEFQGLAWGEITDAGFQGEVNGTFRNVDLYRLVQEQFPHTLNGAADIQLVRAKFRNGRLENAAGSMKSSGGSIGRSLLATAAKQWNLDLPTAAQEVIPFAEMHIGFEVDGSVLRLSGHCGKRGTGWLADAAGNTILSTATETTAPVLSLVRVLVTQSEVKVPLTEETANLLSIFPVPAAQRPTGQANLTPSTTLRLDNDSR